MKRIAIIGSGGAGKSILARQLGESLGIHVIHLDSFYWKPGWVATAAPEWERFQEGIVGQDSWIIDGNYRSTVDLRLAAADTIIFLDFPRALCLYRVLKRRILYAGKTRADMAEGCPERIDWDFVRWIWSYPADGRPGMLQKIEQYREGREVIIFHSPRQVKHFLQHGLQFASKNG